MQIQSSPIRWFDVLPSDLHGVAFENLSERFRWQGVTALVTHLGSLNGTVVILLSPIGSVFCSPFMGGALYWHGHNSIDWGRNQDRNRAYAHELRRAKIKKADPQARLFGNFDRECRIPARSLPSLSANVDYLEIYRLESYGFDRSYETPVRQYLERMFDQLGHWAFVPFPESERVADFEWKQNSFDYWLLAGRPQSMAFLSDSEAQYDELLRKVTAELKRSVARIEDGMPFDIELAPICRIKAHLHIHAIDLSEKTHTVEILSYRARLIRLLGWPIYYSTVQSDLQKLRDQWPVLVAGKSPPYDPIHELECYLAEMVARFPVLGEDPFA